MTIDTGTDLHPYGNQQLVGQKDIIRTVTEKDNSNKEYEMEIVVNGSQHSHGNRKPVSYPDSDSDGELCNLLKIKVPAK